MAQVDYLMLETPQPEALQRFYCEQMGFDALDQGDGTLLLEGPSRRLVVMPGPVPRLAEVGFAVASGEHLRLGRARLETCPGFQAIEWPLFQGEAYSVVDPEGVRLVFGVSQGQALGAGNALGARLQHVGISTSNVPAMREFYFDKLGFLMSDEVFGDDGTLRSIFVRSSPEHHCVAVFGNGGSGFDHMSFEAPNWNGIRDWADHFARFGTKQFWGPGRHGVGNNLFLFVLDPDGRMVEISAELDLLPNDYAPGRWAFDYKAYNLWGAAAIRV
jgi:catechol 2,3-dioxygenase-like lactoylglutathione lyase family enzyme